VFIPICFARGGYIKAFVLIRDFGPATGDFTGKEAGNSRTSGIDSLFATLQGLAITEIY
jgi:hypothetical protein